AAVSAVAGALGELIRTGEGLGRALTSGVVAWILSLVFAYIFAWLIDILAPRFGGTRNRIQALKVSAYTNTASWLASILAIVPPLQFAPLVGGLSGLYLCYLGLPVMMKNPPDRSFAYILTIVVIVIVAAAVIVGFFISLIAALLAGAGLALVG